MLDARVARFHVSLEASPSVPIDCPCRSACCCLFQNLYEKNRRRFVWLIIDKFGKKSDILGISCHTILPYFFRKICKLLCKKQGFVTCRLRPALQILRPVASNLAGNSETKGHPVQTKVAANVQRSITAGPQLGLQSSPNKDVLTF